LAGSARLMLAAGVRHLDPASAVFEGMLAGWARKRDKVFKDQYPHGAPAAFLDGQPVASEVLYDPQTLGERVRG